MMSKVKILLYCTKGKPFISYDDYDKSFWRSITDNKCENYHINGKIVAECECDKVEEIVYNKHWNCYADNDSIESCYFDNDLACLSVDELKNYLGNKNGYALHLSNVKVLDKPLSIEKDYIYTNYFDNSLLTKAPQNMCSVYDRFGNKYILISIQPQHLVNILNGKKTIEVRKSILNGLKELM